MRSTAPQSKMISSLNLSVVRNWSKLPEKLRQAQLRSQGYIMESSRTQVSADVETWLQGDRKIRGPTTVPELLLFARFSLEVLRIAVNSYRGKFEGRRARVRRGCLREFGKSEGRIKLHEKSASEVQHNHILTVANGHDQSRTPVVRAETALRGFPQAIHKYFWGICGTRLVVCYGKWPCIPYPLWPKLKAIRPSQRTACAGRSASRRGASISRTQQAR